jgi:hypothetical protein
MRSWRTRTPWVRGPRGAGAGTARSARGQNPIPQLNIPYRASPRSGLKAGAAGNCGLGIGPGRDRYQVKNVLNVTALALRAVVNYGDGRSCCQGPDSCERLHEELHIRRADRPTPSGEPAARGVAGTRRNRSALGAFMILRACTPQWWLVPQSKYTDSSDSRDGNGFNCAARHHCADATTG